jgi:hypothetical protein
VGGRSWWDWWRYRKCQGEEEIFPGWEDQVDRDRGELVEEVITWSELGAGRAPEVVADVADGMDGEGQQVQTHQDGGEILLPVSKAVLKVVALVLQYVERLVLGLPPRPAAGGKFDDSVATGRQIGSVDRAGQGWPKVPSGIARCFGEQLYQPDGSSQADVALAGC